MFFLTYTLMFKLKRFVSVQYSLQAMDSTDVMIFWIDVILSLLLDRIIVLRILKISITAIRRIYAVLSGPKPLDSNYFDYELTTLACQRLREQRQCQAMTVLLRETRKIKEKETRQKTVFAFFGDFNQRYAMVGEVYRQLFCLF